jgi:PLP dependent protein
MAGPVGDATPSHGGVATMSPPARPTAGGEAETLAATAEDVAANLAAVRRRIEAAGGDPARITVVGVTKGFGSEVVSAAVEAGLVDLGENYAQQLVAKAAVAPPEVRWHFLGPVQRNKVAALSPHVGVWETVDRLAVGEAISRRQPGARVFVQVDVTGEPGKHGCSPSDLPHLVAGLRGMDLDVRGLMAIGPAGEPELARPGFRQLAMLAGELGVAESSMGMSGDLEVGVSEGASVVRIGRALFGPRPGSPHLRR